MSTLHRRWRALVREVVYVLDLDDGQGNPSMTKAIALALVVLAFVAVLRSLVVSGNVVLLVVVAISAAFGRSMWMRYLTRGKWSLSGRDETRTERRTIDIREEIIARRAEDGTEPAGKVPQAFDD
jgi:hypothetical protein